MEIYVVEYFEKNKRGQIQKPVAYLNKNEAILCARSFASERAVAAGGTFNVSIDHSIGYEMSFVVSYTIGPIDVNREVCRIVGVDLVD